MSSPDYSDKESVRNHYLAVRNKLSSRQFQKKSRAIIEQLKSLTAFWDAKTLHTYVSINEKNEVDTVPLITSALHESKQVVVPKMKGNGLLKHILIHSLDELTENSWGVPEPIHEKSVSVEKLDLVVVPMVVGDVDKNRIGYGKGFYDRFLSQVSVPKVGLLFECQLSKIKLPTESFDIPLDVLITEERKIE